MSVKKPLCPELGLESVALSTRDRPALTGAGHADGRVGSGAEWPPDARPHHEPRHGRAAAEGQGFTLRTAHGLERGRRRTVTVLRGHARRFAQGAQRPPQ